MLWIMYLYEVLYIEKYRLILCQLKSPDSDINDIVSRIFFQTFTSISDIKNIK